MDKQLFDLLHETIPTINEDLAGGLAYKQLQQPEIYVDRAITIASKDFPPEVKYVGYHVCTPKEEFAELTRRRSCPTTLEISRRDLFMVKYMFTFNDGVRELPLEPWCLLLPIVSPGGTIVLNGSLYQISPVAIDIGMSVGQDEIFLKVNSNQLKFHRSNYEYLRNGEQISTYVVWTRAHNKTTKPVGNRMTVKAVPTLAHYLFAKYGVTHVFNVLANCQVVIGDELKVNRDNYPADKWYICQSAFQLSTNVRPTGVKDKFWKPSNIRLAIPRDKLNYTTDGLIAGFFYALDLFPRRFESIEDSVDNTSLWRVLMGIIYWGEGESEGKHLVDISAHIDFLDKEMDTVTQQNLADTGVYVSDIYDLFVHLIETYSLRVTRSITQLSSMYGKRLSVIDYVMKDVIAAINYFKFAIQPSRKKSLTFREVTQQIWSNLKSTIITNITRPEHSEVSSISMPGDNMIFKGTSQLVLQSESNGPKTNNTFSDGDPSKYLHISIAELGSVATMSKSEPTGRSKLNPFARTEADTFARHPQYVELLDQVQRSIER